MQKPCQRKCHADFAIPSIVVSKRWTLCPVPLQKRRRHKPQRRPCQEQKHGLAKKRNGPCYVQHAVRPLNEAQAVNPETVL